MKNVYAIILFLSLISGFVYCQTYEMSVYVDQIDFENQSSCEPSGNPADFTATINFNGGNEKCFHCSSQNVCTLTPGHQMTFNSTNQTDVMKMIVKSWEDDTGPNCTYDPSVDDCYAVDSTMLDYTPGVYYDTLILSESSPRQVVYLRIVNQICSPTAIFVDKNAPTSTENGCTWTTAMKDLQNALSQVASGDTIFVAEGTYFPTSTADRSARFNIPNGVVLLGGYPTGGGPRNYQQNKTILSGEIGGASATDNSYTVVRMNYGVTASTRLDGFTIEGGYANHNNAADDRRGAAINVRSTYPRLYNIVFQNNYAIDGGAVYTEFTSSGDPTLFNCVFYNNTALDRGGAWFNQNADAKVTQCIFNKNTAERGGAVFLTSQADAKFYHCNFIDNHATQSASGGAVYNEDSSPKYYNSVFWANKSQNSSATSDDEIVDYANTGSPNPTMEYCLTQIYSSGSTGLVGIDPNFVDEADGAGPDGCWGTADDGFQLEICSRARNFGNNNFVHSSEDFYGQTRIIDNNADAGIFEYQSDHIEVFVNQYGTGSGISWAESTNDLNFALLCPDADTIFVSEGIYKPHPTDRSRSITLSQNTSLLGGYSSDGSNRDWKKYPTILSGELGSAALTDNSIHVLFIDQVDSSAMIEGFVVERGYADGAGVTGDGGGIYCNQSTVRLSKLEIRRSTALDDGGGLYIHEGRPILSELVFDENEAASSGGGIYFLDAHGGISRSIFKNNKAVNGGGLRFWNSLDIHVDNVLVYENEAARGGGAHDEQSEVYYTNCTFHDNKTTSGTTGNTADAVFVKNSDAYFENCIFSHPTSDNHFYFDAISTFAVDYSLIEPSQSGVTGTGNILDQDPKFLCESNEIFHLQSTSPAIDTGQVQNFDLDLIGNPRLVGSKIDMGAFEYSISATTGNTTLEGPFAIPAGQNHPGQLADSISASDLNYKWQRSLDCTSGYTDITNATNVNYPLPILNQVYCYRRCVDFACPDVLCTDPIEVQAIPANGIIRGKIVSQGSTPVPNIAVTVNALSAIEGDQLADSVYTAITDANGEYEITDIYYGPEVSPDIEFSVTPAYEDHGFDPSSRTRTLSASNNIQDNVDFVDTTTFVLTGNVFQYLNSDTCGLDSVAILLDGVFHTYSNEFGDYAVNVPGAANYTVTPNYHGHTFNPTSYQFLVLDDAQDLDFHSSDSSRIYGVFSGGCDAVIGIANLRFKSEDQCFSIDISTDSSGNYSLYLPSRKYEVEVIGFSPIGSNVTSGEVLAYFASSIPIDVSSVDTNLMFIYHAKPELIVTGMKAPPSCGYTYPLAEQSIPFLLEMEIVEEGSTCPLDTGTIIIRDAISDRDQTDSIIHFTGGLANYAINPGEPNLTGDHLKNILIIAKDDRDRTDEYSQKAFVEGFRARQQSFTTVTPEIPLFILRDPPGDGSYSFLSQSNTHQTRRRWYALGGGSAEVYKKVKVGKDAVAYGEIGGSLTVSGEYKNTEESVMTLITSQQFKTSGNSDVIGDEGDVFIGAAMNLIYAVADVLQFDESRCEGQNDVSIVFDNNGFNTTYIYTQTHIENEIIPDLEFLRDNTTNQDSIDDYNNQIDLWNQTLALNTDLKEEAEFVENVSFSADASLTSSTTRSSSTSKSVEFSVGIELAVSKELGASFGGSKATLGGKLKLKSEFGMSDIETTTNQTTVGYHLSDDDAGDNYTVDIKVDPVYNTPVFDVISAETSCPFEPRTLPRHDCDMSVDVPIQYDIPAGEQAEFVLSLNNISQSNDNRTYKFDFNQESNPDGAQVTVNGSPYTGPLTFSIPYLGTQQVTVRIAKASVSDVFAYEGLEFRMYPSCDPYPGFSDILVKQSISVFFDHPCSDITMAEPGQNWISSTSNSNMLAIKMTGYDRSNLDRVDMEFAPAGTSSWTQAFSKTAAELNNNSNAGTTVQWNTGGIDVGAYEVRLKLICGSNIIYTPRAAGIIDHEYPDVLGIPSPISGAYDPMVNDISIRFDEQVDCAAVVNNFKLTNQLSGYEYPMSFSCYENEIVFNPQVDLSALAPAPYRLELWSVSDAYGNTRIDTTEWTFTVGDFGTVTCDENTIYYVDAAADPSQADGRSWEHAFPDLISALYRACPGSEIWVAEGTYYPKDTISNSDTLLTSFHITHGYALYGGFPSGGSTFEARNPKAFPTYLDGDINHNSVPDTSDAHTIIYVSQGISTILDGFIISNGFANSTEPGLSDAGTGIYNRGQLTLSNCVLTANVGATYGGAIYQAEGSLKTINCLLSKNSSVDKGSAIFIASGDLDVINATVTDHTGGSEAIFISPTGSINLHNSVLWNNVSDVIISSGAGASEASNNIFNDAVLSANFVDGGNNLLNTNPSFVNSALDNYRLQSTSAGIDHGDNGKLPSDVLVDLDNTKRKLTNDFTAGAQVDAGAYELSACAQLGGADTLHVDATGSVANLGESWSDATASLQKGIIIAEGCGIDVILVAEGTYLPDFDVPADARAASFVIPSGVQLYGGFEAGGGARDWMAHPSVLSGDIGTPNSNLDNSYSVVRMKNVNDQTRLDGFVIERGYADGLTDTIGGGVYHEAEGFEQTSSPVISNCVIRFNNSNVGGGFGSSARDGAICAADFINCRFEFNRAIDGGAVSDEAHGFASLAVSEFVNCAVLSNEAADFGGAYLGLSTAGAQSLGEMTNVTIANNKANIDLDASGDGGGIYLTASASSQSQLAIRNSVSWSNTKEGQLNQAVVSDTMSTITWSYSVFDDGAENGTVDFPSGSSDGGGNLDANPNFKDATNNDYRLTYGSPALNMGLTSYNIESLDLSLRNRVVHAIDCGAYEFQYEFPCGEYASLVIDEDPILSAIYRASGLVQSAGLVRSSSNGQVEFQSQASIELLGGFEVKDGQEFKAVIQNPCID